MKKLSKEITKHFTTSESKKAGNALSTLFVYGTKVDANGKEKVQKLTETHKRLTAVATIIEMIEAQTYAEFTIRNLSQLTGIDEKALRTFIRQMSIVKDKVGKVGYFNFYNRKENEMVTVMKDGKEKKIPQCKESIIRLVPTELFYNTCEERANFVIENRLSTQALIKLNEDSTDWAKTTTKSKRKGKKENQVVEVITVRDKYGVKEETQFTVRENGVEVFSNTYLPEVKEEVVEESVEEEVFVDYNEDVTVEEVENMFTEEEIEREAMAQELSDEEIIDECVIEEEMSIEESVVEEEMSIEEVLQLSVKEAENKVCNELRMDVVVYCIEKVNNGGKLTNQEKAICRLALDKTIIFNGIEERIGNIIRRDYGVKFTNDAKKVFKKRLSDGRPRKITSDISNYEI